MENKREIKVKLSTVVAIFEFIIILAFLIGVCYLMSTNKVSIERNEKENDGINNIENAEKVSLTNESAPTENPLPKEEAKQEVKNKKDYDYKKTVTLNGIYHEISFKYNEITSNNQEDELPCEELKIFFDGKDIKTYIVYREENRKEEEKPEIHIIEGEDAKQYAIITVPEVNPVVNQYYFNFINDEGEVVGLATYSNGTGMVYKGKGLSYNINKTNMEIYKPIMVGESGNDFVIKYVLRVSNNFVTYSAEEVYKADEVEFSGARY